MSVKWKKNYMSRAGFKPCNFSFISEMCVKSHFFTLFTSFFECLQGFHCFSSLHSRRIKGGSGGDLWKRKKIHLRSFSRLFLLSRFPPSLPPLCRPFSRLFFSPNFHPPSPLYAPATQAMALIWDSAMTRWCNGYNSRLVTRRHGFKSCHQFNK